MGDLGEAVCPRCGVGFAPDTTICPICKIPLVFEAEDEDGESETPEPIILDDAVSSLEKLRTGGVEWIHHLQDKLAAMEIPHRIELYDSRRRFFSAYVRHEDLPRAKEIDDEVFAAEVPESEGMAQVEDLDFSVCPGCGSRLGEKDLTCSSCGLELSLPKD